MNADKTSNAYRRLSAFIGGPIILRIEAVFDFFPVDHVPPGGEVIRPAVLILQVVSVLPDVATEDHVLAFHDGVVLVGGGSDLHTGAVLDQPCPAGAET